MADTTISWTDKVWNPTVGCSMVSAGCTNCYAERMARRLKAMGKDAYQEVIDDRGRWSGVVKRLDEKVREPLYWRKPARVFVDSMSDLFHPSVPFEFISMVFAVMSLCRQHTFQVLTKRPERMLEYFHFDSNQPWVYLPSPNVWLGVSVEDQQAVDKRIPPLTQTPAVVRFLSCEPLLGPLDIARFISPNIHSIRCNDGRTFFELESGQRYTKCTCHLDWVIAGGESGPHFRPMELDWARSLHDQCKNAGVAFWMKQDSGPRPGQQGRIPDELWVKGFPETGKARQR